MLPDRVSNPEPRTYESGALPIALRGPAFGRELPKELSCETISKSVHDLAKELVKSFFLFIALAAILFNGAEPFEQFW